MHIVFEVMNFVYSDQAKDLFSIDKHVLIVLAKHHGPKGIYPSVDTLSKELNSAEKTIRRSLLRLSSLELIKIESNPGHTSHYSFTEKVIHTLVTCDRSVTVTAVTGDQPPRSFEAHTPVTRDQRSYKRDQIILSTQRGETKKPSRSPSGFFEPSSENQKLAEELKLDLQNELRKFRLDQKVYGRKHKDEQAAFELWLLKGSEYNAMRGPNRSALPQDDRPQPQFFDSQKLKDQRKAAQEQEIKTHAERLQYYAH